MIFTDGIGEPEGPVLLEDESWLIVEMSSDRGCITNIDKEGQQKKIIARTGRPNGLAVDKERIIWVAETMVPSLLRLTMNGNYKVFLTSYNNEDFLFPNDLVFGPDGLLYMTDSGILFDDLVINGEVREDYLDAKYDGRVYKIDIKTKQIAKIDTGILFPNGLVFGLDGNLYVNETITGMVYRYKWRKGEVVGPREEFGNVIAPGTPPGFKGPDGMKFGLNGHLYVTVYGQGDVTVLGKDGMVTERIKLEGMLPTNCAFGPEGSKKLYVTDDEFGRMEVFDVGVDGFPLYKG